MGRNLTLYSMRLRNMVTLLLTINSTCECLMSPAPAYKERTTNFERELPGVKFQEYWAQTHDFHDGSFRVHWVILQEQGIIRFFVEGRNQGYVAVGFSEAGGMKGADILMVRQDEKGWICEDMWVEDYVKPQRDVMQNCHLRKAGRNDTHTYAEFERKLVTCDKQDNVIDVFKKHFVWAMGDTDELLYHGSNPKVRGGKKMTILWDDQHFILSPLKDKANITDIQLSTNLTNAGTQYYTMVMPMPDEWHTEKYIIGIGYTPGSSKYIHHIDTYKCRPEVVDEMGLTNWEIEPIYAFWPIDCEVLANIGVGTENYDFPATTSMKVGGTGSGYLEVILIVVHFNLMSQVEAFNSNWKDIGIAPQEQLAGVRFRWLDESTQTEIQLSNIVGRREILTLPPGHEELDMTFEISSTCTKALLPPGGITIYGQYGHMHLTGRRFYIEHFRDGHKIGTPFRENYHDFNMQNLLFTHWDLLPGDRLLVHCVFDTIDRVNVTHGGFGATNEMCDYYMLYTPGIGFDRYMAGEMFEYKDVLSGKAKFTDTYCGSRCVPPTPGINYTVTSDQCQRAPADNGDPYPEWGTNLYEEVCQAYIHQKFNERADSLMAFNEAPTQMVVMMALAFFILTVSKNVLERYETYKGFALRRQRNVDIYALNLICQNIQIVIIFVYGGHALWRFDGNYYSEDFMPWRYGLTAVNILCAQYFVEMAYRVNMDSMLILHHCLAIFFMLILHVGAVDAYTSLHATKLGMILGLMGCTEQPMFFALLARYMKPEWKNESLMFAASIWDFLSKSFLQLWGATVAADVFLDPEAVFGLSTHTAGDNTAYRPWFRGWGSHNAVVIARFFAVWVVPPALLMLYLLQLRTSWILWKLSYPESYLKKPVSRQDSGGRYSPVSQKGTEEDNKNGATQSNDELIVRTKAWTYEPTMEPRRFE